ncbi:hypothetical protein HY492_01990 [Candidatus Woesearchaeota archaeon]|nr:hypothetical protein [Candidatus Woesearchaeota archaeon]
MSINEVFPMRFVLALLVLLSLVSIVSAQYACYSEDELVAQQSECKAVGLDYLRYTDANGCGQVRCQDVEVVCPTRQALTEARQVCQEKSLSALSSIDTNECEIITCGSHRCATEQEYQNGIVKCQELGREVEELRDGEGCKYSRCLEHACDEASANAQVEFCKKQGLVAREFVDDKGCRSVKCTKTLGGDCTKSIVEDCTIFSCADGSSYNTCTGCPALKPAQGEPAVNEGFFKRLARFWGFGK